MTHRRVKALEVARLTEDRLRRWLPPAGVQLEREDYDLFVEAADQISALLALSDPAVRDAVGWVIEGAWSDPAAPQYWAGSSLWMSDHMCAIRFAREHDAKQAASAMLDGMNIRICQHIWSDETYGGEGP